MLRVPTNKPWKISMIFQWYFKTKFPNFHDNSECHKTEKHRITSFAWPPYTSYVNFWLLLRKSVKVFLLDLKNSISVNNLYNKIHLFTHVVSQTYVYFRIQWFFHEWLSQNSMIFPFLQISRAFHEIQWFFHDLETDLNFNDFSRAVGTLMLITWWGQHGLVLIRHQLLKENKTTNFELLILLLY